MKINSSTQYPHNPQKEPQGDSFGDIEDIEHRNENVKAIGYGCAGCGNRIYQAVKGWEISEPSASFPWTYKHKSVTHWKCEGCAAVFSIIGGTRGPLLIQ
jgi:hypothetical protein